jgi:hypothetical protein
MTHL